MNIKMKFIPLLLALSLVHVSFAVSAEEDPDTSITSGTPFSASLQFIGMLGVTERTSDEKDAEIMRGEFIDMVMRAMNYGECSFMGSPFTDVTESTGYSGAITTAVANNIIAGYGDGKFLPDEPVTYEAALTIAVTALGYNNIAGINGGFPAGYIYEADRIDLTSKITRPENGKMTFESCAVLIYNFMNADIFEITGIDSYGNFKQSNTEGNCILKKYFSFEKSEGIIKTAGYMSMVPDYSSVQSTITIGSENFKCDTEDAGKFLGFDAVCWYDEENVVKAIYVKPENEIVTVKANDIGSYADFKLRTYAEGTNRSTDYKIDRSYTFVRNGRNAVPTDADFAVKDGYITLIDNTNDGVYDVVLVFSASYMVITSKSKTDETVYGNSGDPADILKLSDEDGKYYNLMIKDGEDYTKSTFDKLSEGMVLMYYASDDGEYVKAVACADAIDGTITQKDDDYIYINGVKYKTNTFFAKNSTAKVGYDGEFLLAADGTVTYLTAYQKSDLEYGYLANFYYDKDTDKTTVRIFKTDGKFIRPEMEDKIILDGVHCRRTDARVSSALSDNGSPKYQVIRYKLDTEGKLSVVDTATDIDSNLDTVDKYNKSFFGNDVLTKYLKGIKSFYYPDLNEFVPHAIIGASTTIISVPYEILTGTSASYEDKYFSIKGADSLSSSDSYYIDVFDMDKFMRPSVIVLYDKKAGDGPEIVKSASPAIVEKAVDALSDDDEIHKTLTLLDGGEYHEYAISADAYEKLEKQGNVPSSGDIIRYTLYADNQIASLVIDAKYNSNTKKLDITSSAPTGGQADYSEYTGNVISHNSSILCLRVDEMASFNSSYSDDMDNKICPFWVHSYVDVAVYDTESGKTRHGSLDMIKDSSSVGEADSSYVFIKSYTNGVLQLFIYK